MPHGRAERLQNGPDAVVVEVLCASVNKVDPYLAVTHRIDACAHTPNSPEGEVFNEVRRAVLIIGFVHASGVHHKPQVHKRLRHGALRPHHSHAVGERLRPNALRDQSSSG